MKRIGLGVLAAALLAGAARAEVTDTSPAGFEVRRSVEIAAPAAKVWAAMITPARWWSSEHSWSGKADNFTFEPRAGGCWCETLPGGGGALHLTVTYIVPNHELRLFGQQGPFQFTGAVNTLDWKLTEKDGHTTVTWTFEAGGYVKGGIGQLSAPVDGVMGENIGRLKAYVETGAAQ
ncbi:SRPBCC family protein [Caulobacter sp. KR2-114]|uniref:SRPBCC family protein n=1 Tax=Caulobacter sp. KR2-114 TaxID=3400912 RepID=UPI003C061411